MPDPQDPAVAAANDVVLIADDEPTNLEMLNRILKGQGYRTLVAKRGELTLKIVAAQHPLIPHGVFEVANQDERLRRGVAGSVSPHRGSACRSRRFGPA